MLSCIVACFDVLVLVGLIKSRIGLRQVDARNTNRSHREDLWQFLAILTDSWKL